MSRACPIVIVVVLLALSAAFAFVDVPTPEVALHDQLPGTLSYAAGASAFGAPDGRFEVLAQVDFELRSRWSNDRGTTYEPERVIAGGAGRADVTAFVATRSGEALYAAVFTGDAQGSLRVEVVASDDLGRSWREPVIVATRASVGEALHYRVDTSAIAARGDRVAVFVATGHYGGYYVVASSDRGRTWSAPVKIDLHTSGVIGSYCGVGLAIDRAGVIHAAFVQYNGRNYQEVQVTRSTDGGVTFEAPHNLGQLLHPSQARKTYSTAITVADDDGVLVVSVEGGGQAIVVRSTDHGATWPSSGATLSLSSTIYGPRFVASENTGTVLLAGTDRSAGGYYGRLVVLRSADHGVTFTGPATLSSNAHAYLFAFDIARTPGGSWFVAWSDGTGHISDSWDTVQASTSIDDGQTWGAARRVDSGGGFAQLVGPAIAVTGADEVAPVWVDGTSDDGRSREIRTNRAAASADFGADRAVPLDRLAVHVGNYYSDVAADGQRVGVLFSAVTQGGVNQLFYRTSADGGRTFGSPVMVQPAAAATYFYPAALLVRADGHVHALYNRDEELFAIRSTDFGATWSVPFALGHAYAVNYQSMDDVQLLAGDGGLVHVAWVDTADGQIKTARSTDGGLTYTTTVVEPDPYSWNTPALCRTSDRLLLTYANSYGSVYGRSSSDGGATWSAATYIGTGQDLYWYFTRLVSDGGSTALVVWGDESYNIIASRWDGTAWSAPYAITSGNVFPEHIRAAAPVPGTVVVAWDELDLVKSIRSTDGGLTFGEPQRLDEVAPDPPSNSEDVRLAMDESGRLWATWRESSTDAAPAIVVRHSSDAGATWGPLYRLDRGPLGAHRNAYYSEHPIAASQGTLFATYCGRRASFLDETLFNVFDTSDFDRDGVPPSSDCSELDPGAWAVPTEVVGLTVHATHLAWSPVSAGSGTVYDLVDGSAAQLRASAFDGAACLASAHAGTTLSDTALPAPGDARYLLVRAHNTCGRGTWGHSTLDPDPRNALDAAPCP